MVSKEDAPANATNVGFHSIAAVVLIVYLLTRLPESCVCVYENLPWY